MLLKQFSSVFFCIRNLYIFFNFTSLAIKCWAFSLTQIEQNGFLSDSLLSYAAELATECGIFCFLICSVFCQPHWLVRNENSTSTSANLTLKKTFIQKCKYVHEINIRFLLLKKSFSWLVFPRWKCQLNEFIPVQCNFHKDRFMNSHFSCTYSLIHSLSRTYMPAIWLKRILVWCFLTFFVSFRFFLYFSDAKCLAVCIQFVDFGDNLHWQSFSFIKCKKGWKK